MILNESLNRRRILGRLGERLLAEGAIADETLRQALELQQSSGGFLGELLVSLGAITPSQLRGHLEEITGFPFVDISEVDIDRDLSTQLPEHFVVSNLVLPFREKNGSIHVAMADPLNLSLVDEIRASLGRPVVPYLALTQDLEFAIKRAFDVRQKTRSVLDEIQIDRGVQASQIDELIDQVEEAPLVRLVSSVLLAASSAGASDIHVEPQEGNVRVRFRVDGVLYDQMTIPTSHLAAFVSRLKVMSGLNIAERRRPQDGRFTIKDDLDNRFDVRLSIMPTVYGEKACMRLLEKSNSIAKMDKLGFMSDQRAKFEQFVRRPHGLVLVTGPTGSGKSTTLYTALQSINDSSKNINTIEDPVEYKIAGINQMQVDVKTGVTFATGLRTLVRQDPDVILVGEIRDRDTAEIAIQAALTGHLVLSTLHTNDAPSALVRLQNMGIEPFLISSAVIGVVGQRLLRVLCPYCRETYTPTIDEMMSAQLPIGSGESMPHLANPVGCRRCDNRGSRGRTAAMEIFGMTDEMRKLVLKEASANELYDLARREGMVTMREAAISKALDLQVSLSELHRVFSQED
ncbi:MAG: Flp pilus assembly complex ATPase component TadA [Armatimonadetes bacterium]|nr:Flp pilus assembly complex ATPase component TadA [Armatimonadota bacterium]